MPNQTLILDFETYYDDVYSLRKMTMTEYIMSPLFKAHGVAVGRIEGGQLQDVRWLTGRDMLTFFLSTDWSETTIIGHNLPFDGGIMSMRLNVIPARYIDTLAMSRAVFGDSIKSHSLDNVVGHITGKAGKVFAQNLTNTKGKRDLTVTELDELGKYAMDDVRETFLIFLHLFTKFPAREFDNMDHTIRMYTQPKLRLDRPALEKYLTQVAEEKDEHIAALNTAGITETQVSSNTQCQQLLLSLGVHVAEMTHPKTGKISLSKSNHNFSKLQDSEDLLISTVVTARLNIKSTIKKSRTEKFMAVHDATGGVLPVPLSYCGAKQTNRYSGTDGLNLQNMPRGKGLRNCIVAPPGHKIVVCDLSNIELRTNMVMCRQQDAIDALLRGEDLYCNFASRLYGRVVTKLDKVERTVGKVSELSLGYGSGWSALRSMLFVQAGMIETEQFCRFVVDTYRSNHRNVKNTWYALDDQLERMVYGAALKQDVVDAPVTWVSDGFILPSGFKVKYIGIHRSSNGELSYIAHSKMNAARNGMEHIYGAMLCNHLNQSIARDVIMDVHSRVFKETGYRMSLQIHDELVYVAPESEAQGLLDVVLKHMHQPPSWWPALPVKGEGDIADNYGDAK